MDNWGAPGPGDSLDVLPDLSAPLGSAFLPPRQHVVPPSVSRHQRSRSCVPVSLPNGGTASPDPLGSPNTIVHLARQRLGSHPPSGTPEPLRSVTSLRRLDYGRSSSLDSALMASVDAGSFAEQQLQPSPFNSSLAGPAPLGADPANLVSPTSLGQQFRHLKEAMFERLHFKPEASTSFNGESSALHSGSDPSVPPSHHPHAGTAATAGPSGNGMPTPERHSGAGTVLPPALPPLGAADSATAPLSALPGAPRHRHQPSLSIWDADEVVDSADPPSSLLLGTGGPAFNGALWTPPSNPPSRSATHHHPPPPLPLDDLDAPAGVRLSPGGGGRPGPPFQHAISRSGSTAEGRLGAYRTPRVSGGDGGAGLGAAVVKDRHSRNSSGHQHVSHPLSLLGSYQQQQQPHMDVGLASGERYDDDDAQRDGSGSSSGSSCSSSDDDSQFSVPLVGVSDSGGADLGGQAGWSRAAADVGSARAADLHEALGGTRQHQGGVAAHSRRPPTHPHHHHHHGQPRRGGGGGGGGGGGHHRHHHPRAGGAVHPTGPAWGATDVWQAAPAPNEDPDWSYPNDCRGGGGGGLDAAGRADQRPEPSPAAYPPHHHHQHPDASLHSSKLSSGSGLPVITATGATGGLHTHSGNIITIDTLPRLSPPPLLAHILTSSSAVVNAVAIVGSPRPREHHFAVRGLQSPPAYRAAAAATVAHMVAKGIPFMAMAMGDYSALCSAALEWDLNVVRSILTDRCYTMQGVAPYKSSSTAELTIAPHTATAAEMLSLAGAGGNPVAGGVALTPEAGGLLVLCPAEYERISLAAQYDSPQLREMLCLDTRISCLAVPRGGGGGSGGGPGTAEGAIAAGLLCFSRPLPAGSSCLSGEAGAVDFATRTVSDVLGGGVGAEGGTVKVNPLRLLIRAAQLGNVHLVLQLLELGVDVNAVESGTQRTALHYAAECGSWLVAYHLIHHGAFMGLRDKAAKTPLKLARRKKHWAVSQLIKDVQATRKQEVRRGSLPDSHHGLLPASPPPHSSSLWHSLRKTLSHRTLA